MSKFFITNSSSLFNKVKQSVEISEYEKAFEYSGGGIFALSTKKLKIDNVNGAKCSDGFAIVTGTMAWGDGESITPTSLQKIYQVFDGNVDIVRKNSIGNYAAAIYKGGTLYVFGEITGFYNIYYYNDDNVWLVSNSLYDMAFCLGNHVSLNKLAFIESTIQDGILLDDTFFNEIHRLSGFNSLYLADNKLHIKVNEYYYRMALTPLSDKLKDFVGLQRTFALKMAKGYGAPTISMTGGLDARMTMSSYLAAGIHPSLYYGTGNSFITNTHNEDKEIDEIFSKKFDLEFFDESWNTPEPIDKYWDSLLNIFGFHYDSYAGSQDFIESICNNPNDLFTYGYCGELYRNLPWIEGRKKDYFTIDEYINEVYITHQLKSVIIKFEEYYDYIKAKQLRICEYYRLNPNHIANEDIFYLSLERRKSADACVLNHVNFIKYCCYTIGQYESLTAGRVSCKEASNSGFMLRCLDALYPEVLDVPVFSHQVFREFHRETMSLEAENNAKFSLKSRLKGLIVEKFPWTIQAIRAVRGTKMQWRFANDEQIFKRVQSLYEQYNLINLIHGQKIEDPRRLVNYVMKVYALNRLGLLKENEPIAK